MPRRAVWFMLLLLCGAPRPALGESAPKPEAAKAPARAAEPARTQATPAPAKPAAPVQPVKSSEPRREHSIRLRDLEQRIEELKERIRRSHTRLSLLGEHILATAGAAHAEIRFKNEMSGAFKLRRLVVVLDGAVQYNKLDDADSLALLKEIPVFSGPLPRGDHTVEVVIEWRGNGFGVFSYLKGYKFKSKSRRSFTVPGGKKLELDIIAWERGGVTTPLEKRPAVHYLERLKTKAPGVVRPAPSASGK